MENSQDDIDFLEEVLENIVSYDLNDKEEGIRMLRDQISHMQKRHPTQQCSGQDGLCACPDRGSCVDLFSNGRCMHPSTLIIKNGKKGD